MDQLLPVVLCGGAGTRLWPASREHQPKQFMSLDGTGSLLQQTVQRIEGLASQVPTASRTILVTNAEHRFLVAGQLMEIGAPGLEIVLEPDGRNTAPALTLAALQALRAPVATECADPVLLVMPSDHVLADKAAFHTSVADAWPSAVAGAVVTFGIAPLRPETGFGYIQKGQAVSSGAFRIAGFREKPTQELAEEMLASANYLWNSGMFMLRASVWLRALGHYRPDILRACERAMLEGTQDSDFVRPEEAAFRATPADSIDYAVMEKLPQDATLGIDSVVVPLDAGWSDVGSWDAVARVLEQDACGNAISGSALLLDCASSLAFSSGRLVVGIGLEHIAVIETADAVLVVHRDHAQNVKKAVAALREQGFAMPDTHRKVHRPWGWYDSFDRGERFQVKRIMVKPGASLSLQLHHHRAEHWIVVKGTAQVTNGQDTFMLQENESTYIPLGHKHRLANPASEPLEIIEVQSGDYLGEDDIVRFQDHYGRP